MSPKPWLYSHKAAGPMTIDFCDQPLKKQICAVRPAQLAARPLPEAEDASDQHHRTIFESQVAKPKSERDLLGSQSCPLY